jgi:predicted nucleic acid-binding Zn finger protein
MWHLVHRFLKVTSKDSDVDDTSSRYLIFDDTTLSKTGKRIEKIGKVWDHVTNSYVLGFKLLVMMYWDGKSSIPLDFSLHREKGKKQERPFGMSKKEIRKQYSCKRIKDSYTAKRVEELDTNKIQMVLRMFFTAIYRGLRVDYVLVDSWFTCDALIQAIRSVKNKEVHLIGMYKFAKTKFEYQGKSLTHAQINNMLGKPRRCRSLGYQYKQAKVLYQGVEICLFFSRRGKRDKWKVLLTTDTKLTFKRLIEHYQVRWVVEVFNRESKQLLNLGRCQSSNFDAQIAETTISMIAYLLLTLRFRYDNYESKGALYRSMNADVLRETLDKRLWGLFIELVCAVSETLEIGADELFERMLTNPKAETMIMALCCSVMVKDD